MTLTIYERLGDLPHFNPDEDRTPLPEPVADLRSALGASDAAGPAPEPTFRGQWSVPAGG